MVRYRLALAALTVLAGVIPAKAEPPEPLLVSVRPTADVGIRTVRVGDVADLTGGSTALRDTVAALDLADASAVKAGLAIRRQQVEFRIRLAEVPASLFRVRGALETRIEIERSTIPEADIISAAKEAILKNLPWGADEVSIQSLQPIAVALVVDAPRNEIRIQAEPHSKSMPLGHVQMNISLWAGGTRQLAFPLYLDVRLFQKVAISLHKVERGDALSETNVTFDRRPVENLRNYISSPEALAGKRARQALPPGYILTANDIEDDGREAAPLLVHRGEAVKLLVRLGRVNVMAAGEALQDGRAGQSVRVRNIDSKQVVLGRVTEKSLVEVDP
jgi:flagella basal body P-ring formation protein FlgA